MEKKWYIIQLIAGYEEKVRDEILKKVKEEDKEAEFGEILIPEVESKNIYTKNSDALTEQLFPGYMVISLAPSLENFRLITKIYRVIRFLGGKHPSPLSNDEAGRILSQISGKISIDIPSDQLLSVGNHVEIIEGPFNKFSGVVDAVDEEKKMVTVRISIFGRSTPVEIPFHHTKK